jgi:OPA family sugar phosphate sensor protein UhpC-like MFS transporter
MRFPSSPLPPFLRTGADRPRLPDPAETDRTYLRKQWTTFLGITIGYSFFYTTRLTLAVAKKPMMDAGFVDAEELGRIGFLLYLTYAFGRLTNGFLCDRAHIGRFMGTGLLVSALLNLLFGWSSTVRAFLVIWALNGWFQSMGSAPSGANIAAWFGRRERGTRYSVWSMAQNIGEGLVFIMTAGIVAALGWRWAFWGPGIACAVVAIALFRVIQDRPAAYGLPSASEHARETPDAEDSPAASVGTHQAKMLRNPAIWILGLASACMYVARYGINEWFVLYLQEAKSYDIVRAGFVTSFSPIVGIAGTLLAGPLSDHVFGGRRIAPALLYGILLIAGLVAIPSIPPGHSVADTLAVSVCGFAIGGLLVFLAGLIAIDISPRRAAGAAMGLVGVFSYLGAAIQNWISGRLIESSRTVLDGTPSYDFDRVFAFWIGAAVLSFLLTLALGALTARPSARRRSARRTARRR